MSNINAVEHLFLNAHLATPWTDDVMSDLVQGSLRCNLGNARSAVGTAPSPKKHAFLLGFICRQAQKSYFAMSRPVTSLLPALRPRVRYDGVPLRYEETKPVVIQAGAHKKILHIGEELHDREVQQLTREQEKAVYTAQEAIWEQAQSMRVEAVEKALHVAQDEHETAMKRMARSHERTLREEVARVEADADLKFREQLAQEKAESASKMAKALEEVTGKWQERLSEALEATRLMEREKATARLAEATREEDVRIEEALAELADKHEGAITDLNAHCKLSIDQAVDATKCEAAVKNEVRLANTRDLYEQQLQVLRTHIGEKNDLIGKLQAALNGLILERARLKSDLELTRNEYRAFVNSVIPVQDAAGFLLPSFHSKSKLKKLKL
ncbi:hypothetical protein LSAT2_019674 [Lamellibrachia satsuma]|nr:hypothetical protein LSAT2_019674 [Lamellibrachia satsuma]